MRELDESFYITWLRPVLFRAQLDIQTESLGILGVRYVCGCRRREIIVKLDSC